MSNPVWSALTLAMAAMVRAIVFQRD